METTDIYALIGVLIFCAAYASAASIGHISSRFRRRWIAASAGVSLAYLFMDIVPELAERSHLIRDAALYVINPVKRIYAITLLGMLTFVAFAHLGRIKRSEGRDADAQPVADWYFLVHIGGFALYNMLIGFLAVGRARASFPSLCIYVFAIALHAVMIDGMLMEVHGSSYVRWGGRLWPLRFCLDGCLASRGHCLN